MKKKHIAIAIYLAIAVLFAIYGTYWGDHAYRGFFYNLGTSLVWPAVIFPALGNVIGGIVMVVVVVAVLVFVR